MSLLRIDFDDIIFRLQKFGGASEYWREITERVAASSGVLVKRWAGSRYTRALPVPTTAKIFHSSHFRVGHGTRVLNVATVHDLIYELGFAGRDLGARFNLFERKKSYFAADALICVSSSTKDDLLKIYPALANKHIEVIAHGLSDDLLLAAHARRRRRASDSSARKDPYLLHVGGRQSYKAFAVALQGYSQSDPARDGIPLLCTGKPFTTEESATIRRLGLDGRVRSAGNVSRSALFELYSCALGLVYPSTYEGFGLPVIEAMAFGCPVIACETSSIPEVAGGAALLVPPGDADGICLALNRLGSSHLTPLIEQGRLHAAKFSWDLSASKHRALYFKMAEQA